MGQNVFPTSTITLSPLQDPNTPSLLDIRPFVGGLKGPSGDVLARIFEQIQQSFDALQETFRSASPSLQYLSIDSADIGVLVVGSQFGPGVFVVANGAPNYDTIGWIGSQPSGSAVTVTSIVAGLVTTAAIHKLKAGDNVYIDGTTDVNNTGFYVVATTPLTTTYTVTGGVSGGNSTGGTSTKQFQGFWVKSGAIGGTAFDTAKFIVDVDGSATLTDATIVLNGSGAKITLDPVIGTITIDGSVSSGATTVLGAGGVVMDTSPFQVRLNPTIFNVGSPGPGYSQGYFSFDSSGGGGITLLLVTSAGTGANYLALDNTANMHVTGNINTDGVYKKGGTSGVTASRTRGTGLTVGSNATGVAGTPGVGQSNITVVTSVTLTTTTDGFSGGILTS